MKTIIALVVALSIGGVAGWLITNEDIASLQVTTAPIQAPRKIQTNEQLPNTTEVYAEDYVSLRPIVTALPSEDLSEAEIAGLLYMREEEKLARDVYVTLFDTWGYKMFSNIAQSEQTHTEAVRDVLEKYAVNDPVTDDAVGVFVNVALQQLYTELVVRGQASLVEALKVGALIEDLDISDLQKEIATADNQDVIFVYENLLRGSRNHL